MPEILSPGITVVEKRNGSPELRGQSTSTLLMQGTTERGKVNNPMLITSFTEWTRKFGSYTASDYSAESAQGFFTNGGRRMYFNRTAHYFSLTVPTLTDDTAPYPAYASTDIATPGSADSVTFTAIGPGAYGNGQKIAVTHERTKVGTLSGGVLLGATPTFLIVSASTALKLKVGDTITASDDDVLADATVVVRAYVEKILDQVVYISALPGVTPAALSGGDPVYVETFRVSVLENGNIIQGPISGLKMHPASPSYVESKINTGSDEDTVTASVTYAGNNEATPMNSVISGTNVTTVGLDNRPAETTGTAMTGGTDGTASVTDADHLGNQTNQLGFYAFDKFKGSLFCVPGLTSKTGQLNIQTYVDGRKDTFAILDSPAGLGTQAMVEYKTGTGASPSVPLASSFCGIYYPQIKIIDPLTGALTTFPPSGHIAGMYARTDQTRGVGKAPAGTVDGLLIGAQGVERILTTGEKDILYPNNINPIEIKGTGVCVMGSRTCEIGEFDQINMRRVFLYVRDVILNQTEFVLFEDNDPVTRAAVSRTIRNFLHRLWIAGVLKGASAEEAYSVICDESNNPDVVVNSGRLVMAVGLAVGKPSEFFYVELSQKTKSALRRGTQ